jgi:signal peptidase I
MKKSENRRSSVIRTLLQIFFPAMLVLFFNLFIGRVVVVSGNSMYPTLKDHDILVIRSIAYTPKDGDIVVCKAKEDGSLLGERIVKRCIATEGQTVFIDYQENRILVDGVVLQEDYLNQEDGDAMSDNLYQNTAYVVPEGCILVLGDNRNHSTDSRDPAVGMVALKDVLGGLMIRIPVGG